MPAEFGGLGASVQTVVETVRLVSTADGGVGQLLQIHNVMLRGIFTGYPDEVRDRLIADVLAGKRFGNALAEIGGKNKFASRPASSAAPTASGYSTAASSTPPAPTWPSGSR